LIPTKTSNTDLLLVGHYTHDVLVNNNDNTSVQRLGGGVAYASVVATALKQNFKVVSKVGHDFHYDEQCQPSPRVVAHKKTTSFINYTHEIPRRHHVSACCEPIYPNDIKESSHIALVCGVIGEILPETIQKLREESVILMGDIQGIIRQVNTSGEVQHVHLDATPYKDVVPLFDYLKVSDEELPYINVSTLRKSTILLVTHGDDGCSVFQKEHQFHIPACAVTTVDSTGAGDSFLTGFAVGMLQELSLKQAVYLGCCCGRIAVQSVGVPKVDTFDNNIYLCEKPCHPCMLADIVHVPSRSLGAISETEYPVTS